MMSSKSKDISRRKFLETSSKAVAGAVAASQFAATIIPSRVFGANDSVTMAMIGTRSQGFAHIKGFAKLPGVRIKTICDIDENLFAERTKYVMDTHGYKPATDFDMRRVFEDKDIDAVSIATPNHWHALATVWACQAGKNVYVEKPSCHSVWEGRQMVHAARANKVLVQVGFQNRSRANTRAGMKLIHGGGIGDVYMAKGLCFKPRNDIGRYPDGPMKEGEKMVQSLPDGWELPTYTAKYLEKVHYDMWIGPARVRPFNRNRFHYNWHWQWEYGNGDTGNQGPHQFDIGRWGLNKEEGPESIYSAGDYFVYDSQQNTPNTQISVFKYSDGTIFQFETRGLLTNSEGDIRIGNIFYGSEGRLEIDAEGNWKTFMGRKNEPGPNSDNIKKEEESDAMNTMGTGIGGHFGNFVNSVRSGKQEDLNCDIEVGHTSSILPHLANISYLLGREVHFDGRSENFGMDSAANALLRRKEYREPYVVPDLS